MHLSQVLLIKIGNPSSIFSSLNHFYVFITTSCVSSVLSVAAPESNSTLYIKRHKKCIICNRQYQIKSFYLHSAVFVSRTLYCTVDLLICSQRSSSRTNQRIPLCPQYSNREGGLWERGERSIWMPGEACLIREEVFKGEGLTMSVMQKPKWLCWLLRAVMLSLTEPVTSSLREAALSMQH